jgi:hypothetical protein
MLTLCWLVGHRWSVLAKTYRSVTFLCVCCGETASFRR